MKQHPAERAAVGPLVVANRHHPLSTMLTLVAFDGKSIGDGKCGMIITLCHHEDGRPMAMIPTTGKKEDSEANEARADAQRPVGNHPVR